MGKKKKSENREAVSTDDDLTLFDDPLDKPAEPQPDADNDGDLDADNDGDADVSSDTTSAEQEKQSGPKKVSKLPFSKRLTIDRFASRKGVLGQAFLHQKRVEKDTSSRRLDAWEKLYSEWLKQPRA